MNSQAWKDMRFLFRPWKVMENENYCSSIKGSQFTVIYMNEKKTNTTQFTSMSSELW